MRGEGLFALSPIWVVFAGSLALVMLSAEGGYRWASHKRLRSQDEGEAPVGAMVGATLGLLALLLAFTFSIASDRYDARRKTLLREANAIGTAYLRVRLIPNVEQQSAVQQTLRAYVDERLEWAGVEHHHVSHDSTALLNELWNEATAIGNDHPDSEVASLFIASVNEIIDLHTDRLIARDRSRIPFAYWTVLYLIAMLGMAAMGYHGGIAGTTRSPVMVAVAIAFALVVVLIVDLDRPSEGFLVVDQQIMVDLRRMMTSASR